jgi:outer membrane protein TolC
MLPTSLSGRPLRLLFAALSCATFVTTLPASADTLTLSLADALRLARERSAALHLVAAEVDAARAEAAEAALPAHDSELELAGGPRFADDGEDLDLELTWSRSLEPRGARAARGRQAAADLAVAETEARHVELGLLAEVAETHALALHADSRAAASQAELALADRLAEVARTRRELGESGRLDETLALAARGRSAASLARSEAHRERIHGRLRAALGLASATELEVVGDLARRAAARPARDGIDDSHPSLAGLLARSERADAELELARTRGRSSRSVHAGLGHEEDALLVFAGVSWSLPAGDRGAGLVEAAAARREALRMARDMERRRSEALLAGENAAAVRLSSGLDDLENQGLASLEEVSRLVSEAYELGAIPLTEVLAAARELSRARTEHLDLLRDAALAALHARTLAGQEPPS